MTRWISLGFLAAATLALGGCAGSPTVANAGPGTPGWTGRTIVVGNNSTIAGDAQATYLAQKWPYGSWR